MACLTKCFKTWAGWFPYDPYYGAFENYLMYGRGPLWLRRLLHWVIFMRFKTYPPPLNALDFIQGFKIYSKDGGRGPASKTEIRRWIRAGNVWVNFQQVEDPYERIYFPVHSLVLFPKGDRITLW